MQRTTGNVVYPGGGGPQIGVPAPVAGFGLLGSGQGFGRPAAPVRRGRSTVIAYPVYVGGYGGYGGYYDGSYMMDPTTLMSQQPNVTVILPPQQPPVIINQFGAGQTQQMQPMGMYPPQSDQPADVPQAQVPASEPAHYLIAFKDHTIYSAIAYWVDGDTLHYFTTGNTHNQVSVSLVDRELTDRLNREMGVEVKLPAPK
ncbi:MAG TPA: hypothetical protein VE959_21680 [Bryobacteraceae bacterium]|nr:hypothetical protein [Bryobacteraceae bacterium]